MLLMIGLYTMSDAGIYHVTNDILLAERCIKKGAFVIKPNGSFYTEDNIGVAIATRKINEIIHDRNNNLLS